MTITEDIKYVGVNDHDIDLFEGQYQVENGMAYNSYVITVIKLPFLIPLMHIFQKNGLQI